MMIIYDDDAKYTRHCNIFWSSNSFILNVRSALFMCMFHTIYAYTRDLHLMFSRFHVQFIIAVQKKCMLAAD